MRILFFAPNYLPATRYGGPVQSTHGLARALVGLGHEVTVLTTDVDGPNRLDVPVDFPVALDGVTVHYCPIAVPRRIYYSPVIARLANALVPFMDAVHINGMFLWPGSYIARVARQVGVPVVVSPRGMLMPEMVAGKSRLAKMFWITTRERAVLAGARAIHVTSEVEAEGLRQMGLDLAPMAMLPNGVHRPDFPPTAETISALWGDVPSGRRVAFLARLDWTKGVDMAIEAVRAHPTATIRIAGHDQIGLRRQLEPLLLRGDGHPCGEFLGPVEGAKKWALLAGADVLLAPSVRESFGVSVAEALLMGTPVIATEGVGAADLLRRLDPGLVVPREQMALNNALTELLANASRRALIREKGRELAAGELAWPAIADRMQQVYRSKSGTG